MNLVTIFVLAFVLLGSVVSPASCQEVEAPPVLLSTHGHAPDNLIAQAEPSVTSIDNIPISDRAKRLVNNLGVSKLVVELYNAKQEEISPSTKIERRLEILYFRQKISTSVRHSILQVQDTIAAVDLDIAHTLRLYDYLDHKKGKYDQRANLVTFLTSGIFTILNGALGYIPNTVHPVNATGILAGTSSSLLPFLSYRKHRYDNPDGTTEEPNMLAQVFDKPTTERTAYNELVWKFLNSPDKWENSKITRRQRILKEWVKLRELKTVSKKDIDVLTGSAVKGEKITLDILNARVNLLSDLRAEISGFYRDLAHLQKELIAL